MPSRKTVAFRGIAGLEGIANNGEDEGEENESEDGGAHGGEEAGAAEDRSKEPEGGGARCAQKETGSREIGDADVLRRSRQV